MTRKLKVAQFVDNYGPGSNGLMVAVQQLEGCLLDAGHEVIVVAPQAKGANPHYGRTGRVELRLPSVRVPRMPTRVASGRHFERTLKRLEQLRPDLLHVHGFGTVGALGLMAARRLGVPMVLTWHTDFDAYADHYASIIPLLTAVLKSFAAVSRGKFIDKAALKAAEIRYEDRGQSVASLLGLCALMLESAVVVTSPSPKTVNRCLQLTRAANVICVPNGVDPLPSGPPPFEREPGPMVLQVGRVAPEKGLPLLIDAFELVVAQRPDARLVLVGDWQRYPKIANRLIKARELGWCRLEGERKREDLGAYYAMTDIFAFPSLTDTQALVLHEAALAGCPIVAADYELQLVLDPGVNGELARPTPASYAAALLRLIDKLDDPQWRENARRRSIELASQWSIASQGEKMLQIYQQVAAGEVPHS